jgi:hypothetical protein
VISALPDGLKETYDRVLLQIPEPDIDAFQRALTWLSFAIMPMTLQQLWEAIAIEPRSTCIDDEARLMTCEDIIGLGKSLISVTPDGHVRLAHLSVRDYLRADSIRRHETLSKFAIEPAEAHRQLAAYCLTYISFNDLAYGPETSKDGYLARLERYPLLKYAAKAWPYHLRAAKQDDELYHLTLQFFRPQSRQRFMSWVQVINARLNFKWDIYPRHATPLYYAATFGLTSVVQSLLLSDGLQDLDAPGSRFGGTPLHGATIRNHTQVMKLLCDAGAQPGKADFNGVTPLHSAVSQGDIEVIKIILGYGAPITSKDGMEGRTPIEWAKLGGNPQVIALLEGKDSSEGAEKLEGSKATGVLEDSAEVSVWRAGDDYYFPDFYEKRSGLESSVPLSFEIGGHSTVCNTIFMPETLGPTDSKAPPSWF